MSGLCFREFFSLLPDLKPGAAGRRTPPRQRLLFALALSALLHFAVVFMPYAGPGIQTSPTTKQGMEKLASFSGINADLRLESIATSAARQSVPTHIDAPAGANPPDDRAAVRSRTMSQRLRGTGPLALPGPVYYTSDQLSRRPKPTAEPALDTEEAAPLAAAGTIILRLWIDARGKVDAADIERTDLPELFSNTALSAFSKLQFVPGERNGQRVASIMRIEVRYGRGRNPLH